MDLIVYIYRVLLGKKQNIRHIQSNQPDIIDFKLLYYVSSNSVFNVPARKIRHHGGQAYSCNQHHFIQYYRNGVEALSNYYSQHNPKTIYEKHFIFNNSNKQMNLPWIYNNDSANVGEHGLSEEHGHSAYGPVSDDKLKLEVKRLDYCLHSIKKNGYLIERGFPKEYNGLPRGYFLISNSGNWVFRVVGAKHRVAALVWLGWKNIPVCCEPNYPRCIFESEILKWPGVVSGEYSQDDAKLIFDSYFRDPNVKIWH
jgi:hypothetical protein